MKYLTAIMIALLAGCYEAGPDAFEVTATVYDRGVAISNLTTKASSSSPFVVTQHSDAPEPVTVGLIMVVNPGESPNTVRIVGSISVNDQTVEPEMVLTLGTATDIELGGGDVIVQMIVDSV